MLRAAEPPGDFRKFLGSSFLSDLTLIICSESALEEAAAAQQQAGEGQPPPPQHQHSPSSAEPQPGTPDTKALCSLTPAHPPPPAAATAPEPSCNNSLPSNNAAANSGASKAAEATGDAPCSGQDHHGDEAHVLPQSPHRAAATAGVGPLSAAAFMQRSASQRQLLQQGTAATADAAAAAAADTSAQQPALRPIATSAPPAPAPAGNNKNSSSSSSSGLLEVASLARTLSNKLSKTLSNTSRSSSQVIVMPVHGVVLAAASPYFETLLRGWACNHQPLQMVVGEEQLAAAQQLLSFMYTGVLQANLPQSDLLQLLLLADRFDVGRALAAARRGLASLSPECFEWTTLNGVWSLPQHLYEGDGDEAAALRGVAWERLLQLFGDLEEAWSTADGRAMWQQLPWRAVSALVASDALAVASENTTFAAVSSWVAHQQHQQALLQEAAPDCTADPRPSLQELQLLTASIRLPALGSCYLSYVCLQQDWFSAAVDIASLARAAAFAAAGPEVRKDLMDYTATSTAAAMQAAAAAAAAAAGSGRQGCCLGRSAAGGSSEAAAVAAGSGAAECIGSTLCSGGAAALSKCSSCGGSHQSGSVAASLVTAAAAAAGCGSGGGAASSSSGSSSSEIEHRMQLLVLAQSMQRQRAVSAKRAGQFSWRVDVGAIRQLYDDVAAAGSRDSRILRSPAHSHAGYEWALQLEVTQTRGATGFDVTKPWSLGVFLTCQVRLEQPAHSPNRQQQQQSLAAATTGQVRALPAAAGDGASHRLSISGSSRGLPLRGSSDCSGSSSKDAASASSDSSSSPQPQQQQQQQQQLVMRLVDFGFVSTSATISLREAAAANKRLEKSWEHAVVRYRASWGWPNFLDAQAVGWDESMFSRWLVDGQLQLSARVRVLG